MRFWLLIGIVWTTLAVLLPAPVRAGDLAWADEAGEQKGEADKPGHDKGGHGGHPERSPYHVEEGLFKGSVDLALWTIVIFLVLIFVLRQFAWKHIAEGLDRREASIARDREEARKAKEEAAQQRELLQAELAKAHEQVRQIIDKARHDAEAVSAELLAKGKADLQAERERLNRELQASRDQALQEIWSQGAQLAALISAKTIRRHLTPEDHQQLVDEALGELRAAAEDRKRTSLGGNT